MGLVMMGCDPELFLKSKRNVVASKELIPKEGMKASVYSSSKIVQDGVQIELNPSPEYCRALLGNNIAKCFKAIKNKLDETNMSLDFSQKVTIKKEVFEKLPDDTKKFGCAPSNNSYTGSVNVVDVNPLTERTRVAGGHIHIGCKNYITDHITFVKLLDIIVGNTCVMIDTNRSNKIRRKIYGRAGDYRLPAHGVEYRTLSNFWLQSYQLTSMVLALVNIAYGVMTEKKYQPWLDAVETERIVNAINDNNVKLAIDNFLKIRHLFPKGNKYVADSTNGSELYSTDRFMKFVEKGKDFYFKEDILTHWVTNPEGHGNGWESWFNKHII